ncbi:MAG: hypothetical protein JST40_14425 [Armatimonadetes bacterium]|nr:hypothetical protein [Armatimonadota bacterium]
MMKFWIVFSTIAVGCSAFGQLDYFHTPAYTDFADSNFTDSNGDGTDGTKYGPIFVADWGDDAWPGSQIYPLKTINAGIITAYVLGRKEVYLYNGTSFTNEVVDLLPGISLVGGFDSNWVRKPTIQTYIWPSSSIGSVVLFAEELNPSDALLSLNLKAQNGFFGTSQGSVALYIRNAVATEGARAQIDRCTLAAGGGGQGQGGANQPTGAAGIPGSDSTGALGTAYGLGGNGHSNNGGWGGDGEDIDRFNPICTDGDPGRLNNFPLGGSGGARANSSSDGSPGGFGPNGTAGKGGSAAFQGVRSDGGSGTNGTEGGGGGGGGGSAQYSGLFFTDKGSGGGGGGGGGLGGAGGGGGQAGGSSVAVFLQNPSANSPFYITNSILSAQNAGAGGVGGAGGLGGPGAAGGLGKRVGSAGRSGDGGPGGNGGPGGGGAGGGGGWSCAILAAAPVAPTWANTQLSSGVAGAGGTGGAGASGAPGGQGGVAGFQGNVVTASNSFPTLRTRMPSGYLATHIVAEVLENSSGNVLTPVTIPNPGTLGVLSATNPSHGSISLNNGTLSYTPTPGYVGFDKLSYTVPNGANALTGTACIYVALPIDLTINLGDWYGSKVINNLTVQFYTWDYQLRREQKVSTDGSGHAFIPGPGPLFAENYFVRIKHSHWLSQERFYNAASPTALVFNLINGDVDFDNQVTVFDYWILSDYFDMISSDANWLMVGSNGARPVDADLDGDGAVTVFDYLIISDNFDKMGPTD